MDLAQSLYGLDKEELIAAITAEGFPPFRAAQISEWLYTRHLEDWELAKNLPRDFIKKFSSKYALKTIQFEESRRAGNGESTKFLFKTHDARFLESVLIEQKGRRTLCLSTQLGCKIGCVFCASGKGKFGRNLTAGEIVEQVVWVQKEIKQPVTNIVFMGMGEPLDNFEPTMKALKILQAPWGFGLGSRRITVSTSGITPKILEFVKRSEGRVRLSVSLHSSDEKMRTELVPINKKYSIKNLMETLGQIHKQLKRDITFEYTLIADKNDSKEEAEGVARIAKPLNAKVNLIPYNPIREMDFKTPSQARIEIFRNVLEKRGVRVIVRQTSGQDIDAACGQLRLDRESS